MLRHLWHVWFGHYDWIWYDIGHGRVECSVCHHSK